MEEMQAVRVMNRCNSAGASFCTGRRKLETTSHKLIAA